MNEERLISIIIPVYNVLPYLEEALNSVISQTYRNIEIIVVDDGSTDGSGALCDELKIRDDRIVVVHQTNQGLSTARNTGLSLIHGEAVAFLDSDDAFHPDFVKTMLEVMASEDAEMVVCKYTEHNTEGKMSAHGNERLLPLIEKGTYDKNGALCKLCEGKLCHIVWNKLYKSKLWKEIRYPDGHVYEDRATTFRILDCCKKIAVIDDPLVFYRVREKSISNTYSKKNILDRVKARLSFDSYIESHIPEIFTDKHLEHDRQSLLDFMILDYIGYSKNKDKDKVFIKDLRNLIIQAGKNVKIQNCNIITKVGYRLIYIAPFLITPIYSVYQMSQKTLNKQ